MARRRTEDANASPLAVGVVWDDDERDAANRAGCNYWYAYVWDILERLGVTAFPVHPAALRSPARLSRFGSIILGGKTDAGLLPADAARALTRWVRDGGTLIGFATGGLDSTFGIEPQSLVPQPDDAFAITGYLELPHSTLARTIHSDHPEQPLIVISPIKPLRTKGAHEVARFFRPDEADPSNGALAHDSGLAAVTARRLGGGWAFYFGFDLPHTMWAIQQGRRIDADYDGDGYLRFGDAIAIGRNNPAVAYSDELASLLRAMLAHHPIPMIHELPAREGTVPDALFHFGGDDECEPGCQISASDFMTGLGLPYHINLMPLNGSFAISRREFRHIRANGHELSLHFNFMDGFTHPGPFRERDVREQVALFRRTFGRLPVCSVNHWCRWTGWAEPARWMRAAGVRADNSRIHWTFPPLNPVNRAGFAFGTSFPYFFRDDWRGGNERIPFLQEPITAYELGYEGDRVDTEAIHRAVDLAAREHLVMDMFYHPVHIHHNLACRTAIAQFARYVRAKRLNVALMGNDELWRWWWERSRARISGGQAAAGRVSFTARCGYRGGFVVKVPFGRRAPDRCTVDGRTAPFEVEHSRSGNWAYVPLATGEHSVELRLRSNTPAGTR
jgi:hypothetical protein